MTFEGDDVLDFVSKDVADAEGATERFLSIDPPSDSLRTVRQTPLVILG